MKKSICLIAALIAVLTCFSQTAEEYLNRGSTKLDLQDYRGAIADFTKAIELNPNYALFYNNRARSKEFLQDFGGAIVDYTIAINL